MIWYPKKKEKPQRKFAIFPTKVYLNSTGEDYAWVWLQKYYKVEYFGMGEGILTRRLLTFGVANEFLKKMKELWK